MGIDNTGIILSIKDDTISYTPLPYTKSEKHAPSKLPRRNNK